MAERKKHAEAISLLMDAITFNSEEELRAKNKLYEAQQMMDKGEMPNAAAIMMVNAKDSLDQRQEVMTELWDSIAVLVDDRKRSE